MVAATVRGRSWVAGLCLAGAICLKVIPAFLLLFPLWKRDWRCLCGCAVGLVIGLGVLPVVVFGGWRTLSYYQKYTAVLLGPALGVGSDESRAKEMIETTANDSQSLQATLHNTLHPIRAERPAHPTALVRWIPRLVGLLMTVLTLIAGGHRRNDSGLNTVLLFGALVINMLLLSPICHMHYFSLCVIVVMGLMAAAWEKNGTGDTAKRRNGDDLSRHFAGSPRRRFAAFGLSFLLAVNFIVYVLPNVPGWLVLRDLGLAMYPVFLLWLVGTLVLWQRRRSEQIRSVDSPAMSTRAA
jgi:Glycosyltransferase family 87